MSHALPVLLVVHIVVLLLPTSVVPFFSNPKFHRASRLSLSSTDASSWSGPVLDPHTDPELPCPSSFLDGPVIWTLRAEAHKRAVEEWQSDGRVEFGCVGA